MTDETPALDAEAPEELNVWLDWAGGEPPVPADAPVEVKYRDGRDPVAARAGAVDWSHGLDDPAAEVVAYRPMPEALFPSEPGPEAPPQEPAPPAAVPADPDASRAWHINNNYQHALAALLDDGTADPFLDWQDLLGYATDPDDPHYADAKARRGWKNRVLDPAHAAALADPSVSEWTAPTYQPPT